jgi:hypothetical protein
VGALQWRSSLQVKLSSSPANGNERAFEDCGPSIQVLTFIALFRLNRFPPNSAFIVLSASAHVEFGRQAGERAPGSGKMNFLSTRKSHKKFTAVAAENELLNCCAIIRARRKRRRRRRRNGERGGF